PVLWREPVLKAAQEPLVVHRKLVSYHGKAETLPFEDDTFWSPPRLDRLSLRPGDAVSIKQSRCAQKAVLANSRPALPLRHVVEGRTVSKQFFKLCLSHHDRLSITFRQLKFIEIRLTGTPETRSTSSMNRTVSSCNWSKR